MTIFTIVRLFAIKKLESCVHVINKKSGFKKLEFQFGAYIIGAFKVNMFIPHPWLM